MDSLFYKVFHNKYLFNLIISKISNDSLYSKELNIGIKYDNIVKLKFIIENKFWDLLIDKLHNNKFLYIDCESVFSFIENCRDKSIWDLFYLKKYNILCQAIFDPIPFSIYTNNKIALKIFLKDNNIVLYNSTLFSLILNNENIFKIYKSLVTIKIKNKNNTQNQQQQQQQQQNQNNKIFKSLKSIFKYRSFQFNNFDLIELIILIINSDNYCNIEKESALSLILSKIINESPDIESECNNINTNLNISKLLSLPSSKLKIKLIKLFDIKGIDSYETFTFSSNNFSFDNYLELIIDKSNSYFDLLFYIKLWYSINKNKDNDINNEELDSKNEIEIYQLFLSKLCKLTNSIYFNSMYIQKFRICIQDIQDNSNKISMLINALNTLDSTLMEISTKLIKDWSKYNIKESIYNQIKIGLKFEISKNQNEIMEFFEIFLKFKFKDLLLEYLDWISIISKCTFETLNFIINKDLKFKYIIIKTITSHSLIKQLDEKNEFSKKSKLLITTVISNFQQFNDQPMYILSCYKPIIDNKEYIDFIFENQEFYKYILKQLPDPGFYFGELIKELKFDDLNILNYFFSKLNKSSLYQINQNIMEKCYIGIFQKSISNCDIKTLEYLDSFDFKFSHQNLFNYELIDPNCKMNSGFELKFHFNSISSLEKLLIYLNETGYKSFSNFTFGEFIKSIIYFENNYEISNKRISIGIESYNSIYNKINILFSLPFSPIKYEKSNTIFKFNYYNINFQMFPDIFTKLFEVSILSLNYQLLNYLVKNNKNLELINYSSLSNSLFSINQNYYNYYFQVNHKEIIQILKLLHNLQDNLIKINIPIINISDLYNNLFNILLNSNNVQFKSVYKIYFTIFKNNKEKIIQLSSISNNHVISKCLKLKSLEFYNYIENNVKISTKQQIYDLFTIETLYNDYYGFNHLFSVFLDNEMNQLLANKNGPRRLQDISIFIQHLIHILLFKQIELSLYYIEKLNKLNGLTTTSTDLELETMIGCLNSGHHLERMLESIVIGERYKDLSLILTLAIKSSNFYLISFILDHYKSFIKKPLPVKSYALFNDLPIANYILNQICENNDNINNNSNNNIEYNFQFDFDLIDLNYYFKLKLDQEQEQNEGKNSNENSGNIIDENFILNEIFLDTKQDLLATSYDKGYTFIIDTFLKVNPDNPTVFTYVKELFNENRFNLIKYYYHKLKDNNLKESIKNLIKEHPYYYNFKL